MTWNECISCTHMFQLDFSFDTFQKGKCVANAQMRILQPRYIQCNRNKNRNGIYWVWKVSLWNHVYTKLYAIKATASHECSEHIRNSILNIVFITHMMNVTVRVSLALFMYVYGAVMRIAFHYVYVLYTSRLVSNALRFPSMSAIYEAHVSVFCV